MSAGPVSLAPANLQALRSPAIHVSWVSIKTAPAVKAAFGVTLASTRIEEVPPCAVSVQVARRLVSVPFPWQTVGARLASST